MQTVCMLLVIALVLNYCSIQGFLAANRGMLLGKLIILQGFMYYLQYVITIGIGTVLSSKAVVFNPGPGDPPVYAGFYSSLRS